MISKYSKYIEHTCLKPEATSKDIDQLIEEAIKYEFRAICINSSWIKYAKSKLVDTKIKIVAVVGFPLGASNTQTKLFETKLALKHGADEIDMVINIGKLKEAQYDYVLNEIQRIKHVCQEHILKVIIETALLKKNEKIKICQLVVKSNADYVKTSTGFSYHGATIEDVKLMSSIVKNQVLIKAAGGIKNLSDLKNMLAAGANTVGASSGVKIVTNQNFKGEY